MCLSELSVVYHLPFLNFKFLIVCYLELSVVYYLPFLMFRFLIVCYSELPRPSKVNLTCHNSFQQVELQGLIRAFFARQLLVLFHEFIFDLMLYLKITHYYSPACGLMFLFNSSRCKMGQLQCIMGH